MKTMRFIFFIILFINLEQGPLSYANSKELEVLQFFPSIPKDFDAFKEIDENKVARNEQIVFRFSLEPLKDDQVLSYILINFRSTAIVSPTKILICHIEWHTYRSGHLERKQELDWSNKEAELLLNAIDMSEIFSLTEAQERRRLPISGRLLLAEERQNGEARNVARCIDSSVPAEYIVKFFHNYISPDL